MLSYNLMGNSAIAPGPEGFITVWRTTLVDEVITLGVQADTVLLNCLVDWGDGSSETVTLDNPTHEYALAGDYTIVITGSVTLFQDNQGTHLISVIQISDLDIPMSLYRAFKNNDNLVTVDLVGNADVSNLSQVFDGSTILNGLNVNLPNSSVTNLSGLATRLTTDVIDIRNLPLAITGANICNDCTAHTITLGSLPALQSLQSAFSNCDNLLNVIIEENFPDISTIQGAFYYSPVITSVDLSMLNLPILVNASTMFMGCSSLTSVNWMTGTSALVNITYIFSRCSSLINADLTGLDTSAVNSLTGLMNECTSLKTFAIGPVGVFTSMQYMFAHTALESIDLSQFDTSSCQNMGYMFDGSSLLDADASIFDISSLTNAQHMFTGSGQTTATYDTLLAAWSAQTVLPNVMLTASPADYTDQASRDILTNAPNNWDITDAGLQP